MRLTIWTYNSPVAFKKEKRCNSVADFDDMIWLFVRRLRSDSNWRDKLQKQFDHLLMDEAQDTNRVCWQMINGILAPDNMNMYCVGDPNQSIYGFNGAEPGLFIEYSKNWHGVVPDMYKIQRNHRSVPEIVKLANVLQSKMTRTLPLKMESWRETQGHTGLTKLLKACLAEDIAENMAAEIRHDAHLKKNTILYKDNAILVRASIQIREIEAALVRRRIPYIVRGGRGLLQTEEVRDILAYLRLAANHKDFMALVRAVGVPKRGFGEVALEEAARAAANASEGHPGDLVAACRGVTKLATFIDTIDHIAGFTHIPLTALHKVIQLTRYKDYIREKYKKDPDKLKTKLENIERFVQLVDGLVTGGAMTTEDLVFQLCLDRPKDESDKARIERRYANGQMTEAERDQLLDDYEQARWSCPRYTRRRGWEWKRAYIFGRVEGSIPHRFSCGSEEEISEERRLLYEACTRARTFLCCVSTPYNATAPMIKTSNRAGSWMN